MRLTPLLAAALLALACTLPASAQPRMESDGISVGLADITPHLGSQFPWQREVMPGVVSVQLARPELSLPGNRAELAVDIAVTTLGRSAALGRATLSSGLRLDGASAAVYLDAPRLVRFAQPDGQPLTLDASMAAMVDDVLASYARQQPVYTLPAELAPMASRVQAIVIENGRLRARLVR
jgi:hypothetical protein